MKSTTSRTFLVMILLLGVALLTGGMALQFQASKVAQMPFDVLKQRVTNIEDVSEARLDIFGDRITNIEGSPVVVPLSIAYINIEDAFTVFTDMVGELRQKAFEKQDDLNTIQRRFAENIISEVEYQDLFRRLQIGLLRAQIDINTAMIDELIAAPVFFSVLNDLEQLQTQSISIGNEVESLTLLLDAEEVNLEELNSRFARARDIFTQIDGLLTTIAASQIVEQVDKVAAANNYDLVVRAKNIIIYRNARVIDITDMVKQELVGLFK